MTEQFPAIVESNHFGQMAGKPGGKAFRAIGITAYLANGGTLEHAQLWPRTTKLYDRTKERLT